LAPDLESTPFDKLTAEFVYKADHGAWE